jgi:hypothetical protein
MLGPPPETKEDRGDAPICEKAELLKAITRARIGNHEMGRSERMRNCYRVSYLSVSTK